MLTRNVFLAAPLLLLAAACSASVGSDTKGQAGVLSFSYVSSQCGFGCALDRPVVEGAMITIQASGGDPNVHYTMTVDPPSLGTVSSSETCTCEKHTGNTSQSRSVDFTTSCAAGETKSCVRSGEIQTLASGSATVKVVDPSGKVIDSATFAIQKADKINTSVRINDQAAATGSDGTYAIHVGDKIAIHSDVLSGGKSMVFTKHGVLPSYSNTAVVASDGSVLLGATDTEYSVATGPGTASVTMSAHGYDATSMFRVVSP